MTKKLRGVSIGAGYFSRFHHEAWARIPDADLVAVSDLDAEKAKLAASASRIPHHGTDYRALIEAGKPDFVEVVTPPETHLEICRFVAEHGIDIICQKPLAPTFAEAREIVALARSHGVRFMVHDNFRFQPWHREIKRLLDDGAIGDTLHSLNFRSRPGDGWGDDAYLSRQPYFRDMPRFLIFETGVHFNDTFRFLAGEIERVHCVLRRLNQVIAGEDCGLLIYEFQSGAVGLWDANRYNESSADDPRYTFGEFLVEGSGGSIRLAMDGTMTLQTLGEKERPHRYVHERRGFGGDCCHATLKHFVHCLRTGEEFETGGEEYLRTLAVQEALYESATSGAPVTVAYP